MPRSLPTFLIIGAPRAGTTSLFEALSLHPDVYVAPEKEPGYFAIADRDAAFAGPGDPRGTMDVDEYQALFSGRGDAPAAGEASTLYFSSPGAPERMAELVPDVRLIVILRHPVDRAYSNYMQHRQQGREPMDRFEDAVAAAPERLDQGWSPFWDYLGLSRYAESLRRYHEALGPDQVKVFRYEDLRSNSARVFDESCAFIGVNPEARPAVDGRRNASGTPYFESLHRFVKQPNAIKRLLKPLIPGVLRKRLISLVENANLKQRDPLDPAVRARFTDEFVDDIREVESITGFDLSAWRAVPSH